MGARVLLYELENSTGKKIQKLCKRLNIEAVRVKPEDYKKTLKQAAEPQKNSELQVSKKDSLEQLPEPMLVFIDLSDDQLDRYLKEYKVMHIDPIDLKAVLTEHNQNWDAFRLYQELSGERNALKNRK